MRRRPTTSAAPRTGAGRGVGWSSRPLPLWRRSWSRSRQASTWFRIRSSRARRPPPPQRRARRRAPPNACRSAASRLGRRPASPPTPVRLRQRTGLRRSHTHPGRSESPSRRGDRDRRRRWRPLRAVLGRRPVRARGGAGVPAFLHRTAWTELAGGGGSPGLGSLGSRLGVDGPLNVPVGDDLVTHRHVREARNNERAGRQSTASTFTLMPRSAHSSGAHLFTRTCGMGERDGLGLLREEFPYWLKRACGAARLVGWGPPRSGPSALRAPPPARRAHTKGGDQAEARPPPLARLAMQRCGRARRLPHRTRSRH